VRMDMPHQASTNGAGAAPSPTTAIAVILDETGSMGSCRDTAISGFNEWLVSQRQVGEPCVLTLTKFSSRPKAPMCRVVCDGAPIRDVRPLDHSSYQPDGNTPLYDAIGQTLTALDRLSPQHDRRLVVILTDGEENASREYSLPQIQEMIRAREGFAQERLSGIETPPCSRPGTTKQGVKWASTVADSIPATTAVRCRAAGISVLFFA
jgi:hypothetical protein